MYNTHMVHTCNTCNTCTCTYNTPYPTVETCNSQCMHKHTQTHKPGWSSWVSGSSPSDGCLKSLWRKVYVSRGSPKIWKLRCLIWDWILQPWLAFSYANINDTRFIFVNIQLLIVTWINMLVQAHINCKAPTNSQILEYFFVNGLHRSQIVVQLLI